MIIICICILLILFYKKLQRDNFTERVFKNSEAELTPNGVFKNESETRGEPEKVFKNLFRFPPPYKIMVGIVTIDRDINYAQILLNSIIQNGIDMKDIYVCTRETDTKIIEFWKPIVNVITINHYDILNRHNMNKIANKRQILLDIANDKKYDYIWFIDSDIIPTKNILNKLLKIKSNVAIAPYPIKWMVDKSAVVGIKNEKIFICKNSGKIIRCTIGGMGW
jgi:hypothetical protein